jgi:hypothetical protein
MKSSKDMLEFIDDVRSSIDLIVDEFEKDPEGRKVFN